ncbi:MAG: Asp-tRNA(Asn)/Glu-tRNA(Gln) amidotransferase subunit GatA [Deinococcus sp.]|nr:Asp-tRNA(Asn)/Glu-tRNA(Gln) amidotransferase subunit GatA [Deinococcus sp.]
MTLTALSAAQLAHRIQRRELSALEVTEAFLERIAQRDQEIHAFLHVTADSARARAKKIDQELAAGRSVGPLAGVAVGIKDNICVAGVPATCGSKILQHFVPPYSATAVERLLAAGAVVLGKMNMDEFGMGSSGENSAYGPARNPHDPSRVPGGSSSGPAAAVAARMAVLTLGSDTGGSVRQPAALCGLYGLRPTYGRVSRYGLVAFASSLDTIGPLTRTIEDLALGLQCTAGHDPLDSTSLPDPVPDYLAALQRSIKGQRLGLVKESIGEGNTAGVRQAVQQTVEVFRSAGAAITEVSLPYTDYGIAAYYLVCCPEASSNLARYAGMTYGTRLSDRDLIATMMTTRGRGFGPEVRRRILIGTYALSAGYHDAYYAKALKVRRLIAQDYRNAFARCDLLLTPTSPTPAFRLGEKTTSPLEMYLADVDTVGPALAGLPSLSIPAGFEGKLPVGLQLIAPPLGEELLLSTAAAFERETGGRYLAP